MYSAEKEEKAIDVTVDGDWRLFCLDNLGPLLSPLTLNFGIGIGLGRGGPGKGAGSGGSGGLGSGNGVMIGTMFKVPFSLQSAT